MNSQDTTTYDYQQEYTGASQGDPYDTQLEFWGKFYFSPTIRQFEELDKNLTTTNLSRRYKEPELARTILQILHILNKYVIKKVDKSTILGYKEVMSVGKKEKVPVYKVDVHHVYEKSVKFFISKFYNLVTTSAAADGFKTKAFNTRRIKEEKSVKDLTEKPSTFNFFGNRNNNNEDRR